MKWTLLGLLFLDEKTVENKTPPSQRKAGLKTKKE